MPKENEFNTLGRSSPGPRMVAFKPAGERGPTVYRDMEGIAPEHVPNLTRFAREIGSLNQRQGIAHSGSSRLQPTSQEHDSQSYANLQLAETFVRATREIESLEVQNAALVTFVQRLAMLLPGRNAAEAPSTDPMFLTESSPHLLQPHSGEILLSEFDDLFKRKPARTGGLFDPPKELRPSVPSTPPSGAGGVGLFPVPDVKGGAETDPSSDGLRKLEDERKRQEDLDKLRRLGEDLRRAIDDSIGRRDDRPPEPKWWDPPIDAREELKRKLELPLPLLRPGVGVAGPWPIPGTDLKGGLVGGTPLGGSGLVGGFEIELPNGVRIWVAGSGHISGGRIGVGAEGGISFPFPFTGR